MKRVPVIAALCALLSLVAACATAAPIPTYPPATTPLTGQEQMISTQAGNCPPTNTCTVNVSVNDILAKVPTIPAGSPIQPIPAPASPGVVFADGAINSGSKTFVGAAESLTNADIGKGIVIIGAGGAVPATGYLDLYVNPHASDTVTIGTTTITFVASGATGNQVNIGGSPAASAANLVAFITANSVALGVHASVTGPTGSSHVAIVANATGTSGNSIVLGASCGYSLTNGCNAERVVQTWTTLLGGATGSPLYGTISAVTDIHTATLTLTNGCSTNACNSVSGANGYYAADNSGTINTILSSHASNVYMLGPYNYGIASSIQLPSGVSLLGQGENERVLALAPMTAMVNDEDSSSGFGVDATFIQQVYLEGGGLAKTCFYGGPFVVKDVFVNDIASDCQTGFEVDGVQNSTYLNDQTTQQLVGSPGVGTGSPELYPFRVLNGASGDVFINDEAAGGTIRSWQFAPDSGEPGYNTFPGGTNQGPLNDQLISGIEEDGPAPVGVEFNDSQFIDWISPVLATGGGSGSIGPNVVIGASSSFIKIENAQFNAGGSNRTAMYALLNNGFKNALDGGSFAGNYGATGNCVVDSNNWLFIDGRTDFDDPSYKTCSTASSSTAFVQTMGFINGEPNVTTDNLVASGTYMTAFNRAFACTTTFGLNCRPYHFDDGTVPITYAATITPNLQIGDAFFTVLTGNVVVANPTNLQPGMTWKIEFDQDATAGRTATWGNKYVFPGGTAACALSSGITNGIDYFEFFYDGALIQTVCHLHMGS